ncbi:MAG: LLM class flavin-dependent oxidoreductase [Nonomuraea sp.]|nr:LLM class flavin-dependent oxidoreductase [Nonomuraea sp.]
MADALGLVLPHGRIGELAEWAADAEKAGFGSVWAIEYNDRSAVVSAAALAAATRRITVGTSIAYAFGRSPLVLAVEAMDLDALSGGRFRLGIGTGTTRMLADWHGVDPAHPAPRMEELVPLLRRLWRLHEGPVAHDGRFYRLRVSPRSGSRPPERAEIPVDVAGVNPRMIAAAGAVADRLLGHQLCTPAYVREVVRPALATGARGAGRNAAPPIAGTLLCSVDDDADLARRRAAETMAFYAATRTYATMLARHGYAAETERVRRAWRQGDPAGMAEAVSDRMLDDIALAGTPREVRDRFAARWRDLYETTLLFPVPGGENALIDAFRA